MGLPIIQRGMGGGLSHGGRGGVRGPHSEVVEGPGNPVSAPDQGVDDNE